VSAGDDAAVDPAEAAHGLFLIVPPDAGPDPGPGLEAVLALGVTVGVLLPDDAAPTLRSACRAAGVAAFAASLDGGRALQADGVLLDDAAGVGATRRQLGTTALVGARVGVSRHAAMVAGEDGADFVAFGASDHPVSERLLEVIAWWSELMVLPSLALASPLEPAAAARLRAAGADFLGVAWPMLVADPPGAAAALASAFGLDARRG